MAIDLGTSGPKVALIDTRGKVLGCETRPTRLHLPEPGAAEQSPTHWWEAIVAATHALHRRQLADPSEIEAVCVTAQWAGTVAVDEEGVPLHDAIVWMDTRGAAFVPDVTRGWPKLAGYGARRLAKWVRRSGGVPSLAGKEPVAHILYLRHERPEVYRRAHKFLEPKDWLNHRLTGRFAASTDSIALHWVTDNRHVDAIDYDPELLELATIERNHLPDLLRATDVLGPVTARAAHELGISANAQVVMGTPDVQSAILGSGAVRDYEGHLYLGTSSWITCHVPFKRTSLLHNIASLPAAVPGRYFVANATETAGGCINWLRDRVLWADDALATAEVPADFFSRLDSIAATAAPGCGRVLFTPWLFGERSPVADPDLRASFFNVSLNTGRAELCRAVLEGVAYNTRWLLEHVEQFIGQAMGTLRFIGGGANSALWAQIHANILDREIEQVERPIECNARGAGLLACLALGHLALDDISQQVRVTARFTPEPRHRAIYDELYGAYRELHRTTRGLNKRLNRDRGSA